MPTFRDITEEALYFRRTQISKYTHVYSITLQVPNAIVGNDAITLEPILQIMEDADFHVTHMSGSVSGPTDINGKRISTATDFGLVFPMAGTTSRGDRGIFFKFLDVEANRILQVGRPAENAVIKAAQLTSPWDQTLLAFNDVFTPGYGFAWGKPIKFDYTLTKSTRLKIILQNRQRAAGLGQAYARVSMAFIGHRYATI